MNVPTREIARGDDLAEIITGASSTAIVVMTHQYERDVTLVESALRLHPMYIGLLGSRGRSARIVDELRKGNVISIVSRLHAPTGLDLGSETIEEIALSIIAEIQAVRRNAHAGFLRDAATPVHGRGSARRRGPDPGGWRFEQDGLIQAAAGGMLGGDSDRTGRRGPSVRWSFTISSSWKVPRSSSETLRVDVAPEPS